MNNATAKAEDCYFEKTGGNYNANGGVVAIDNGQLIRSTVTGGRLYTSNNRLGANVYASGTSLIDSCLITGATSGQSGVASGAVYLNGNAVMVNSTVAGNASLATSCKGVYVNSTSAKVVNCVIYGNGGTAALEYGSKNGSCYTNCAFAASCAPANTGSIDTLTDAAFASSPSYYPADGSVLIGAADIEAATAAGAVSTTDLAGNPRTVGGTREIGAYERVATVRATLVNKPFTYDAAAHTNDWPTILDPAAADCTVLWADADGNYTLSDPRSFTDAGSWTNRVKISAAGYEDFYGAVEVLIKQKLVTVTLNNKTITYGEAPQNAGIKSWSGFAGSDTSAVVDQSDLVYSYNYQQGGAAGSYQIRAEGLKATNYVFNYTAGTLTVNKKAIAVTPTAGQSKAFGAADPVFAYTITSGALYDSDTLAGALGRAEGEAAGEYKINLGTLATANSARYTVTLADANVVFTILPDATAIILKASATAGVYNGADQRPTLTVTASDGVTPLTAGVDYDLEGFSSPWVNAGTYTVTAVGKGARAGTSTSVSYTISKAAYSLAGVAFSSQTFNYDGESHSIYITGTLPAGVTVAYAGNGKTAIGAYTVTASFTGDATNYEPIADKTATMTIVTVRDLYVATTGSDVTGDGSELKPFASVTNAVAHVASTEYARIHVADGTYTETNINLNKGIELIGNVNDVTAVVIQGRATPVSGSSATCYGRVLSVSHSQAYVHHLTLRNGSVAGYGGNLNISNGLATDLQIESGYTTGSNSGGGNVKVDGGRIARCVITDGRACTASNANGAGANVICSGSPRIENCLITKAAGGNVNQNYLAAIYVSGSPIFVNCTIAGNNTSASKTRGVYSNSASARFYNCVIFNNGGSAVLEWGNVNSGCFVNCAFSSAAGFSGTAPVKNLTTAHFVDTTDYRQQPNGPLADVGDGDYYADYATSATDLRGGARIIGKLDIGAYEVRGAVTGTLEGYEAYEDGEAHTATLTITYPTTLPIVTNWWDGSAYTLPTAPTYTLPGTNLVKVLVSGEGLDSFEAETNVIILASRPIVATLEGATNDYDQAAQGAAFTLTEPGDAEVLWYNEESGEYDLTAQPAYTAVGVYTSKVEISKFTYLTKRLEAVVKINPVELTLAWGPTDLAYTGIAQTPVATLSGVLAGDMVEPVVTGAITGPDADSTATVTGLMGAQAANYVLTGDNLSTNFHVGDYAGVVVTLENASLEYTGSVLDPGITVAGIGETVTPEMCTFTWSPATLRNAGTYTLTVTRNDPTYAGKSVTAVFTITQKSANIVWGPLELPNTGVAAAPEVALTDLVDGDDVTTSVSGAQSALGTDYPAHLTISGADAPNYAFAGETDVLFSIVDKDLFVSLAADGRISVIVKAGVVSEETPVYLAWDTTDKGSNRVDWAESMLIGNATAAGGTFTVDSAPIDIFTGYRVRAFLGGSGSYTAVDYIEASGTQYIDTGRALTQDDKMTVDVGITAVAASSTYRYIAGSRTSATADNFATFLWYNSASESKLSVDFSTYVDSRAQADTIAVGDRVTIVDCKTVRSITKNGAASPLVSNTISVGDTFTTYGNAYLFYANAPSAGLPSGSSPFAGRVYSYKIERGDEVLQNLVPALNGDVPCMFDTVSKTYLTNAGTGSFTYGGTPHEEPIPGTSAALVSDAVTYTRPAAGAVTLSCVNGEVTVTVPKFLLAATSYPLTLAWDTADQGTTLGDWAHSFVVTNAVNGLGCTEVADVRANGVAAGATMRAFVSDSSSGLATYIAPVTIEWGRTLLAYTGAAQAPEANLIGLDDGANVSATVSGAESALGGPYMASVTGLTGADAAKYVLIGGPYATSFGIGNGEIIEVDFPTADEVYTIDDERAFVFTTLGAQNLIFPTDLTAELLIVGGGGGGGGKGAAGSGGGGGGGGVVHLTDKAIAAGTYAISVGAAGTAGAASSYGGNGGDSTFDDGTTVWTAVGGGGGAHGTRGTAGKSGGSGGGSSKNSGGASTQNTYDGCGFGHAGGASSSTGSPSGGGGAGSTPTVAKAGGAGLSFDITGTSVMYGAGGPAAGGTRTSGVGSGGAGGSSAAGTDGTAGIVIIRTVAQVGNLSRLLASAAGDTITTKVLPDNTAEEASLVLAWDADVDHGTTFADWTNSVTIVATVTSEGVSNDTDRVAAGIPAGAIVRAFLVVDSEGVDCSEAFQVGAKAIMMEWGATEFDYNGLNQAPEAFLIGVREGDDVSAVVTGAAKQPGTHTATATGLTGADAAKYVLKGDNLSTQFTIREYKGIVLVLSTNEVVYTGAAVSPELTVTAIAEEITPSDYSITYIPSTHEEVGFYTVRATRLTGEYAGQYVEQSYVVLPKPVTVTVDAASKVRLDPDPTFTYTVEPALVGTNTLYGAVTREEGETVGTYAYLAGDLAVSANYEMTLVLDENVFTITERYPVEATVTGGGNYTYDGSSHTFGTTITTPATGVTVKWAHNDDLTSFIYDDPETFQNAGSYKNVAKFSAAHYFDTVVTGAIVIAQAPVTVTADSVSKTYGAADPTFTYTLSPVVGVTGALGRAAGENAGTYNLTLGTLAPVSANYALSLTGTPTLTINPKPITVTATDTAYTKVYGQADPIFTYTLSESVAVTGKLGREAGETVGTYAVQLGTLSAGGNYALTLAPTTATLEITKATYDMSGVSMRTELSTTIVAMNAEPKPYAISGTLPAGVTVTYDVPAAAFTTEGDYTVTANFTGDAVNYNPIPSKSCLVSVFTSIDPIQATLTGGTFTFDGQPHSATLNVTAPAGGAGCTIEWFDEDGVACGATAPGYVAAGRHVTSVRVSKKGWSDYTSSVALLINDGAIIVDDANGDDSSAEGPFKTLTRGYTVATNRILSGEVESAKIRIMPGTYTETGFVLGVPLTIIGDVKDPSQVVIVDAVQDSRAFTITNASARLEGVTIQGTGLCGARDSLGGHIYMTAGTVADCVITGGRASSNGGGKGGNVAISGGQLLRSKITLGMASTYNGDASNVSTFRGGNVYAFGTALVANCVIAEGNSNWVCDGNPVCSGIALNGSAKVVNSTIVKNIAKSYPSKVGAYGVYCESASARVINCVIYGNGNDNTSLRQFNNTNPNCFINCAFAEGAAGSTYLPVTGVTSASFVDYANGDYTPVAGSVLVDASASSYYPEAAGTTDFAGKTRFVGALDIGALEAQPSVFTVLLKVPAGVVDVDDAVTVTSQVFQASGAVTYAWSVNGGEFAAGSANHALDTSAAGLKTVVVRATAGGVTVEATNEVRVIAADTAVTDVWVSVETGSDQFGAGTRTSPFGTIAYAKTFLAAHKPVEGVQTIHVMAGTYYYQQNITLDGAYVVKGEGATNADVVFVGTSSARVFYLNDASAKVSNLTVRDGSSTSSGYSGGNIYVNNGTVEDCIVRNGGAATPNGAGGNIYLVNGRVSRCVIFGGKCTYSGSGTGANVCINGAGTVENCLIYGGQGASDNYKGQVAVRHGSARVVNCTIVKGTCVKNGAITGVPGVYIYTDSKISAGKVINCVIYDNGGTATREWGNVQAANFLSCAFTNGVYTGSASTVTDLTNADFTDYANADYTPAMGGKLWNAGDNESYASYATSTTDLAGNPRTILGMIDIGAYEASATCVVAELAGYADYEDGAAHTATLTVNYPQTGWTAKWWDSSTSTYNLDLPPTYTLPGTNTVKVQVTAPDLDPYYGETNVVIWARPDPVVATLANFTGYVDGAAHSNALVVTTPVTGWTAKWWDGTGYTLDAQPTYSEVGLYTNAVELSAEGYATTNLEATVEILAVPGLALDAATLTKGVDFTNVTANCQITVAVPTAPAQAEAFEQIKGNYKATITFEDNSTVTIYGNDKAWNWQLGKVDISAYVGQGTYNPVKIEFTYDSGSGSVVTNAIEYATVITAKGGDVWFAETASTLASSPYGTWTNATAESGRIVPAASNTVFTANTKSDGNLVVLDFKDTVFGDYGDTNTVPANAPYAIVIVDDAGVNRFKVYANGAWTAVPTSVVTPALDAAYDLRVVMDTHANTVRYELRGDTEADTVVLATLAGDFAANEKFEKFGFAGEDGSLAGFDGTYYDGSRATEGDKKYWTVEDAFAEGATPTLNWDVTFEPSSQNGKYTINRNGHTVTLVNPNGWFYMTTESGDTITYTFANGGFFKIAFATGAADTEQSFSEGFEHKPYYYFDWDVRNGKMKNETYEPVAGYVMTGETHNVVLDITDGIATGHTYLVSQNVQAEFYLKVALPGMNDVTFADDIPAGFKLVRAADGSTDLALHCAEGDVTVATNLAEGAWMRLAVGLDLAAQKIRLDVNGVPVLNGATNVFGFAANVAVGQAVSDFIVEGSGAIDDVKFTKMAEFKPEYVTPESEVISQPVEVKVLDYEQPSQTNLLHIKVDMNYLSAHSLNVKAFTAKPKDSKKLAPWESYVLGTKTDDKPLMMPTQSPDPAAIPLQVAGVAPDSAKTDVAVTYILVGSNDSSAALADWEEVDRDTDPNALAINLSGTIYTYYRVRMVYTNVEK